MNTKIIDKKITKELNKLRIKIWEEIEDYRRDKISFKNCHSITQQVLRFSGIYYRKTIKKDW